MNRRLFILGSLCVGGLAVAIGGMLRYLRFGASSMFDRVVFVCCDEHGGYSPGVYLHGATGGGPAALNMVKQAARYMRDSEVGDAAAGLCGYLFSQLGEDAAGGGLSLLDAPKPGPDKTVNWQVYCGWNVDLVLINVDRGTAECLSGPADPKAPAKSVVKQITGLRLGR